MARSRVRSTSVALLCGLLATASASVSAEAPKVERLIPAGGQRGTTVDCRIVGKPGSPPLKVQTESPALNCTVDEKNARVSISIAPDSPAGVHWLRFRSDAGASELCPFVVGVIPELTETEPNNRVADAGELAESSVTVNGVLEKTNDVDTYRMSLSEGQTVVASMQAARVLKSPMDGVLQIVSQRGTVVAQNDDDCSNDPLVTFTAPHDGIWFVRTFAFPETPNSTIGFAGGADYVYRLTITKDAWLDHTTPLVRQTGSGESKLALHGWNLQIAEAILPADSDVLAGQFAVPYQVHSVAQTVVTEELLNTTRDVVPGQVVSGCVGTIEGDEYRLTLTKNQKITITAETMRFHSLLDPVLAISDSGGKTLREHDDVSGENHDAVLDVTAPADGMYSIRVRDRFETAGERYHYVLSIQEAQPDYAVTSAVTAFDAIPDKATSVALKVLRRNGFSEAITFRVEGLPDGILQEAGRSEKDGDSAGAVTIQIKVPASQQAWSGPIRVICQSVDSGLTRAAYWAASDNTEKQEFWLTITPAAP